MKINYLKTHEGKAEDNPHSEYKRNNWEAEINKFDGEERINYMKEKARVIEEEAMRKEQYLNHGEGSTAEGRNEVNDMIIDSIKAKIALLDNIE